MEQDGGHNAAVVPSSHSEQDDRFAEDAEGVGPANPNLTSSSESSSRTEEVLIEDPETASQQQRLEVQAPMDNHESEPTKLNGASESGQFAPTIPIVIESPPDSDTFSKENGLIARDADRQAVDLSLPKRYEVEAPKSIQKDDVEDDQDLSIYSHNGHLDSSFREIDDAGLDFVDVRLDQSGDAKSSSPYGAGSLFASRSAVEIRQDSISSNSEAAKRVALEAEEREKRRAREQHRYLHSRESSGGSDEGNGSTMSSKSSRRSTSKSVEGRYMGRHSRPHSRATSPERGGKTESEVLSSSSASASSPSLPPVIDVAAIDATMLTMAIAGEEEKVSSTAPIPTVSNIVPLCKHEAQEKKVAEAPTLSPQQDDDSSKKQDEAVISAEESHKTEVSSNALSGDALQPISTTAEEGVKGLSDVADKKEEKGKKKRRESSNKPSALEQYMSRTRMMNLPPKSKQEDVKHLHDYEEMMKLSKEKEEQKQKELEEKRRQKDLELQENMKIWEKDILPSWTRARREAPLRKLWWKGIPPSIRGRLWALSCGNNQMLPRNLYSKTSAEAKQRIQEGTFPLGDLHALEADIEATLPSLKLFQKDIGALYEDLHSVLCALVIVWLNHRDAVGKGKEKQTDQDDVIHVYQRGSASLAAMLMSNLTPSETLIAILNLIAERPWLQALYASSDSARAGKEDAAAFERVFDTLLADQMPKVYANMQARGVRPSFYVTTWVKTLFVPYLPFDLVARLWDCM